MVVSGTWNGDMDSECIGCEGTSGICCVEVYPIHKDWVKDPLDPNGVKKMNKAMNSNGTIGKVIYGSRYNRVNQGTKKTYYIR